MENYSIVLFILALMIGLSAVANRIRIPYPVLLIVVGIAIGFIPSMPKIELNPEIIFLLFLPPLLFDAAFNISLQEFRTNFETISSLAFGLVFLTTGCIAVIAHYMIPGMTWPLSFVLGAILSATDAVAAMTITKGLGLSEKAGTILEGESLVNDASALIAYRFAVAAVTGVAFMFRKAIGQFFIVLGGGFLVGFFAAQILGWALRRAGKNKMVTLSYILLMPFVTYLIAENLKVSGVVAVVILGMGISQYAKGQFPEETKLELKTIWSVLIFLLNGLIFILIGLQFPFLAKNIEKNLMLPYIGYAFIITLVALAVRMARVFLQRLNLQKNFQKKRSRVQEGALLNLQNSVIISWSGMRGIVSLAIAIGLPVTLENGEAFPQRSAIIFISVVVVLFTLIGQGLTLPWIVRRLAKRG